MTEAPVFNSSEGFVSWLDSQDGSLVFTARRIGKVYALGVRDGNLTVFNRTFPEPRGLHVHNKTLFMADYSRIWRFENALQPDTPHPFEGKDGVYIPEMMYRTGNHDSHEIGLLKNGVVAFASTRMNCIAGCTATHGMVPLWRPSFISELIYEDRCHLNGLAVVDGAIRYVTALSTTDKKEGWRDVRADGGVLIDVSQNKVVCSGLSMPHSPRLDGDELWLANSGRGEIGTVDLSKGKFTPHAFIPGFIRGMVLTDQYIIVSTSKFRESKSFQTLPIEVKLKAEKTPDQCGLFVVDRKSGEIKHKIIIENLIEEIYDVALVPGVKNMILGGLNDDLSASLITIAPRP